MLTPLNHVSHLNEVRKSIIRSIRNLDSRQVGYKPSDDRWSIIEILEHLVWTEYWTNYKLWKYMRSSRNPGKTEASTKIQKGAPDENNSPFIYGANEASHTKPRWGGSSEYWINMWLNCGRLSHMVASINTTLEKDDSNTFNVSLQLETTKGFESIDQYFRDQQIVIESILRDNSFPG